MSPAQLVRDVTGPHPSDILLSMGVLCVLGAADVTSVLVRSSLVQLGTPDEMRGRISAVNSLFIGTSNQLGEVESGATASWFGIVPATIIGGVGSIEVGEARTQRRSDSTGSGGSKIGEHEPLPG